MLCLSRKICKITWVTRATSIFHWIIVYTINQYIHEFHLVTAQISSHPATRQPQKLPAYCYTTTKATAQISSGSYLSTMTTDCWKWRPWRWAPPADFRVVEFSWMISSSKSGGGNSRECSCKRRVISQSNQILAEYLRVLNSVTMAASNMQAWATHPTLGENGHSQLQLQT